MFAASSGMLFPALYGGVAEGYDFQIVSRGAEAIVLRQPVSGAVTTIGGTGFVFGAKGAALGGTVMALSVSEAGTETVRLTGIDKALTDFMAALNQAAQEDFQPYRDLYRGETITVDASKNGGLSLVMDWQDQDFAPDMRSLLHVTGSRQNDGIQGGRFADLLSGRGGFDALTGNRGADLLNGNGGGDTLNGGPGADRLNGGAGDDTLSGQAGRDRLFGGKGADWIDGGQGRDTLAGGLGADSFVFFADRKEGVDRVADFSDGTDMIRVLLFSGAQDDMASMDDVTISAVGSDTLIMFGGGTRVLLENVASAQITEEDFIFG